jgi:hypothetical protein
MEVDGAVKPTNSGSGAVDEGSGGDTTTVAMMEGSLISAKYMPSPAMDFVMLSWVGLMVVS